MSSNDNYLEVAVAAPLPYTLTYKAPAGILPQPGCRVLAPLGRRQVTGYILAIHPENDSQHKIRSISEVLDNRPLFPVSMIELFRWIAAYYQYPLGEVIKTALPAGLTAASGRRIILTETGTAKISQGPDSPVWLTTLLAKGQLTPGTSRRIWRKNKERHLLEKWATQGLVIIEDIITAATAKSRKVVCATLNLTSKPDDSDLKKSETKTLDLVRELAGAENNPVPRPLLAKHYSGARQALQSLAAKNLLTLEEMPFYRDPFGDPPLFFAEPAELTGEQQTVMAKLQPALTAGTFNPFLLHGITGSGKTEIYLQAAKLTLAAGRSVLVMVPEIALTTQLEGHFISRFGDQVALLHSGLSKGERFDQWQKIVNNEAKIVIGARSAIFAPLADPGLLIVDEEHDGAYKQEDGLRYQARDLAVLRGAMAKATVILGSATPSVISYQHALNGKYTLLTMANRVEKKELPRVEIINLQEIKTVSGRPPLFSKELIDALRENLATGDQSLVFLNRRGYASLMLCRDCGQPVRCPSCHISLTMHKGKQKLICHYCGHGVKSETTCAECKSSNLVPIGFGTERLETELRKRFPKARIARLDRDTSHNRKDFLDILKRVHNREVDILIGTQMIAKGHHFPHVTLVGVVWADAGLGIPDFRAGERTFQILSQVSGRAGRGDRPGLVIIQSHNPDHYSISTAQLHDYQSLFDREIELRRALQFPPFARLINIRIEGKQESQVKKCALALVDRAKYMTKTHNSVTVLGPAPAPLAKLHGYHRWQLLLKSDNLSTLHGFSSALLGGHHKSSPSTAIKLSLDVDPENML
ncbi:MAG: primosomal protein N' [Thermodesulfobacteriota bacterium]